MTQIQGNGTIIASAIGKILQRKGKIFIGNTDVQISKMKRIAPNYALIDVYLNDGRRSQLDHWEGYKLTQIDANKWRLTSTGPTSQAKQSKIETDFLFKKLAHEKGHMGPDGKWIDATIDKNGLWSK